MARVEELIYMDDHIRKAKQIVDMNEVETSADKLNPWRYYHVAITCIYLQHIWKVYSGLQ